MTDSKDAVGDTRSVASDQSRRQSAEVDALTPDGPSRGIEYLTLFTSLACVGTGIALFAAGDAPTGSPVPLLSLVFIAAGILSWTGAALDRQAAPPESAP